MDSIDRLTAAGIGHGDAVQLRRIAMTLHRWHELECGTGEGQTTYSVERDGDKPDSKPYFRVQYPTAHGYVDKRWPTPDRETGALKRLAAIMARYPALAAYHQTDPRGAALYVGAREDMAVCYTRGVAVTK